MTDYRPATEQALKEITEALDSLAATITAVLDNLATVDAPAPTLAEELRHIAEHWEEWATDTITSAIRAAADRAEQIEQERDEARAEVKRLTAERLDRNPETKARVENALNNLDNAERIAVATVASEENVTPDQQANMQGILAGSLPDPADVKPGEAWLVESGGQTVTACRLHPTSSRPWIVPRHTFGGLPFRWVADSDITIVSRLVPAPRQITTRGELNALPEGTVVRAKGELVCERYRHRSKGLVWISTGVDEDFPVDRPVLPATVLWTPEVPE